MTESPHVPPPSSSDPTLEILQRWLGILRQRLSRHTFRMVARAMVVVGFLGSAYVLGWGTMPVVISWAAFSQLLVFPLFGIGLFWFSRQLDDVNIDWDRWWKVLPSGFFLAALRHLFHSWTLALCVWGLFAILSLGLKALRHRSYPTRERLKQTAWDSLILLVLLTNLFLPRAIFASFVVFLPIVLLVVFYNFILERDRLQRAKALAVGAPPNWLRRANKLLPSSTYLFLLLPGLLFAEAFVFHAVYQTTHPESVRQQDPFQPPKLRDWLVFTLSAKMKAKPRKRAKILTKREVIYRELGRGYSLTASLLRGFLIFFYAKRLLLIFLLMMEKTLGLRVHRIGEITGEKGATGRLDEVRQVLLRTLDSFPRAWAGFLLRGVQGKHGALDPIGTLLRNIQWLRSVFLPKFIPGMEPKEVPAEANWSRLVREEQISLLGQMQDRTWVLESFVDLVSPAHSSTIRGKIYYYTNIPGLRPFVHFYMKPPEPEVRARVIEEIAHVIQRAVETRQDQIVLSDVENDVLTQEQVWTLRDRALTVLGDLTVHKDEIIRIAAVNAIGSIAQMDRPVLFHNSQIWFQLSEKLSPYLQSPPPEENTEADSSEESQREGTLKEDEVDVTFEEVIVDSEVTTGIKHDPKTATYPDPFSRFARANPKALQSASIKTLGFMGVRRSAELLTEQYEQSEIQQTILQSLGHGVKGSGHEDASFPISEEFLLRTAKHTDEPELARAALRALVPLSYPYPIAHSFAQQATEASHAEQLYEELHQVDLKRLELESNRPDLPEDETEEYKEQLWSLYQKQNHLAADFDRHTHLVLERISHTFWTTLHYSASIVLAAYHTGEGVLEHSEFAEYLQQLSFEDPQGWQEWLAHFPLENDSSSLYAPYVRFFDWVVSNHQDESPSPYSVVQQFLELEDSSLHKSSSSEEERWRDTYRSWKRFENLLEQTLLSWTSCLPYRPRSYMSFESEKSSSPSCWQITLTGTHPWLTPMFELPDNVESGDMSLSFEQVSPLPLHPMMKMTWSVPVQLEDLRHGHAPDILLWGHNFHRSPQTHLRQLDAHAHQSYWRAPEQLHPEETWTRVLQRLLSQQEYRPLESLDPSYLTERSQASFQKVFIRSRLREQDALMIVRDASTQLDQFVNHSNSHAPQLFLLAGQPGMGHTTLLLQHARSMLKLSDKQQKAPIVFFLDVGQMTDGMHLVQWLFRELQIEPSKKLAKQLRSQPMDALKQLLEALSNQEQEPHRFLLYVDGFHEKITHGPEILAQCLTLATKFGKQYPWLRITLGLRQAYFLNLAFHEALKPWRKRGTLQFPMGLCYRDLSSFHDDSVNLLPFSTEKPQSGESERSELERAYLRYFNFVDTSGAHRFRPKLDSLDDVDPFGLTYGLLTQPALLPMVLETFHQRELPSDLQILQLLEERLKPFTGPELRFLEGLSRHILFGTPHEPDTLDPESWDSNLLVLESELLDHPEFLEFVEPYKYGVSVYEAIRNRGILIRQWQTLQKKGWFSKAPQDPQRHVTFTSQQLMEYLIHKALWEIAPLWKAEGTEQPCQQSAEWLLSLAKYSLEFQPLEGALVLLLTHLLEHREEEVVAAFGDLACQEDYPTDHLLIHSFSHLSPHALVHKGGILEAFLPTMSDSTLVVLRQLGQSWSRRGLFAEVESLFSFVLEHPVVVSQRKENPSRFQTLSLERADNKRRYLTQQSGGQLSASAYKEGRLFYENALKAGKGKQVDPVEQAHGYRLLALYERDTHHSEEALKTLEQAWVLLKNENDNAAMQMEKAWIRHLQSAVLVRQSTREDSNNSDKEELLKQAKSWSEEAMGLLPKKSSPEKIDLQPKLYDNAARCHLALAKLQQKPLDATHHVSNSIRYFTQSVQSKRALHDYLGLAMSLSGLGECYKFKSGLQQSKEEPEVNEDWKQSKQYYLQALSVNQEQLQSTFGAALTYEAIAGLYFQSPEHHKDGINALIQSLLAYESSGVSASSTRVLKSLVIELAELPVNELYRFVKFVVSEIQSLHTHSEKLIQTLWKELQTVLGESLPGMIGELFTTKSSDKDSNPRSQR